ncbi:hypothetical protein F5Y17DRAFT_129966 [Xylariaceae sp. FL0594]|nr:hypothetical protein F5Y17DRAFT_129966 [Xylariaceae sp. FL0594]
MTMHDQVHIADGAENGTSADRAHTSEGGPGPRDPVPTAHNGVDPGATLQNASRSWWFASTAVPILAATQGPLSNFLSVAALATPWRLELPGTDEGQGVSIPDPRWNVQIGSWPSTVSPWLAVPSAT